MVSVSTGDLQARLIIFIIILLFIIIFVIAVVWSGLKIVSD